MSRRQTIEVRGARAMVKESRSQRDGRIAALHDKKTGQFDYATIRHASFDRAADLGEEMDWVNAYRAERDHA